MTWNIEEQSCCLQLLGISTSNVLMQLITELAQEIWIEWQETQWAPHHFDCIDEGLSESVDISISLITKEILEYLRDVYHTECQTILSVRCNPEYHYCDRDFFDQICQFLFAKSKVPYYLVRSAAFDKEGGYSHQWVCYWKDGQIVREHTDAFFERFFQQTSTRTLTAV